MDSEPVVSVMYPDVGMVGLTAALLRRYKNINMRGIPLWHLVEFS